MNSQIKLQPANYYLLRRPLMPVETFFSINELVNTDIKAFEHHLLNRYKNDPLFMEAIYTASPELYGELCKAINDGIAGQKLVITLYKYLSRMSTRCTPYGLFAGCSTGIVGEETNINYADEKHRKHSRLDMNYVNELVNYLQQIPAVKENILFYVNSSLYDKADTYRYIEYKVENKRRHYNLTSVKKSDYLDLLVKAAENGTSYKSLLTILFNAAPEVEPADAEAFLNELIDSQLLISELEPTVTGDIYFERLIVLLDQKAPDSIISDLKQISSLLKQGGVSAFEQVHQIINNKFVKCQSKDLIQTDLFYEHANNQISGTVANNIAEQISNLYRISSKGVFSDLETFKTSFIERYEEKEVPLLQALDSESGVGYGAGKKSDHLPLLEGVSPKARKQARNTTWSAYNLMVNKLFKQAADSRSKVVQLTDDDLKQLDVQPEIEKSIPTSLYAFGSLIAASAHELDNNNYKFHLTTCSGPSGANILGRFCHGDEKLYKNLLETIATDEADNDNYVYAEIVHLPESRTGNILMRPNLRKYEIPFLGKSAKSTEDQINVQDLMVSVKNGKVILRSKRLNKVIIPRLSTAHNYMTGLPVYRFLCDLQKDGLYHSIYWDWANLSDSRFLPRVEYKNIIINKASWRINKLALDGFGKTTEKDLALIDAYLKEIEVPRFVCVAEYDNELLIDTSNEIGKKILHQTLTKKGVVKLSEFLFDEENCFINNGRHGFANEVILPISNKSATVIQTAAAPARFTTVKRTFIPGSEWIYFKIYGGTKSVEKVFIETLCPYIKYLSDEKIIDKWFFIRYTDPHHHIRLRLKVHEKNKLEINRIITGLYELIEEEIENGTIHKIQLDTYVREIERYGADNIESSEDWFHYDSVAISNILNMIEGDIGETYRWLLAARGLDEILNDFGLSIKDKCHFLETLSDAFFKEFNGDKALTVELNEKYRKHSRQLRSFLNPDDDMLNEITEATAEFKQRSASAQDTVSNIISTFDNDLLFNTAGFTALSSYVHMYLNRFFLSRQRQHELVLYTILYKYYLSEQAIKKNKVINV
ncbi:lantibiotic dehydratase [Mucilaginibacter sp. KACC 22063]|uniref:lantibiotic dehydratase n=1 Tax=Mucilaginibacter sp. KACC 22063 TaxID=3025666 RepID=UPI00236593D6|nr:lantibiotic dehydratase [Mucilaginibacter sp. KACC 22063]WDF56043.1 lantibiotic dehydratase [Mucilaginibacter sp. KACC 22063]